MKTPNRDLLVLVKDDRLNQEAIELELERLNRLLMIFETLEKLCIAHEVFDMNKYRIIRKDGKIRSVIAQRELKPFVFLFNKN
jgi:hypothetical protein